MHYRRVVETEMKIEAMGQRLLPKENRKDQIRSLVEDLREGRVVTDFRFDQIYPHPVRKLSEIHWTPVNVAIRAAELLVRNHKTRVLDVGSGCGKFCTVAALTSPGQFIGVEHRVHLAELAKDIAQELGANKTAFIQGNMADLDWSFFDSFYLFNPFYENKAAIIRIDDTVTMGMKRYSRYIEIVRTKLRAAREGSRVVTYHGFGGDMPACYQLLKRVPIGVSALELWIKMEIPRSIVKSPSEEMTLTR